MAHKDTESVKVSSIIFILRLIHLHRTPTVDVLTCGLSTKLALSFSDSEDCCWLTTSSGPGFLKLTTSLVNVSLKFQTLISSASVFNISLGTWQTLMHGKPCLIPIIYANIFC